jgi:glycosyltransferase involved in cell wall biosynthesis
MFLSHYFPPEVNAPASRTYEHCRLWAAAGHDVTVVTCTPNHPHGKVYPGYANRLFTEEQIPEGIRVIRLWTFLAANQGFARRTLNYLSYLVSVTLQSWRLPRPDIVVSTSPQFFCGLTGLVIRLTKRVPWALEIRDLWPESIVTVGAMRPGLVIRLLQRIEAMAYRHSDLIVSVTDSFASHIVARGGVANKIAVIKNGVDLARFSLAAATTEFADKYGLSTKFVAAYVGTHGMAHGLNTILEAARLVAYDQRIRFVLIGDGAERDNLLRAKERMKLANVIMIAQQPRESMPSVWAATSASIILLRKNELFKKVLPSKMFEAMAMRRPIILGVEGEARALLDEAAAGIAITPENAEELAAAVLRLADAPVLAAKLGGNGRAHVESHFDRRVLAARYLMHLEETVAQQQSECGQVSRIPRQSGIGSQ